MKAAVYNGMLTTGIQPVTASCPTGNCTWPLTPTLAICGGCVNSSYKTDCFQSGCYDGTQTCSAGCNYTMPSGSVASLFDFSLNLRNPGIGFQVLQSNGSAYKREDPSRLYISNFDVFGAPSGSNLFEVWSNASTICSECALWMCVQALNTTTSSTRQTQLSIQDFALVDQHRPSDVNHTFMPLPPSMNPRAKAAYNVSDEAISYLKYYLSPMINGTITLEGTGSSTPSSDTMQAIWNASSDLDSWIKNLALSMTNVIRTEILQPDDMYNGVAFHLGYQVRWEWIILPATLVLLSTLVLVVAIIQTSQGPVSAWKGSPLTLLFMNVDVDNRKQAVGRMDTFEGLQDLLGKRRVLMETDTAGGRVLKIA